MPYGGSFNENTQLTIDIRPIDSGRRPVPESDSNHDHSWFRPGSNEDRPLPVRPIEDYYPPYDNKRPERPTGNDFYNYDHKSREHQRPYLPVRPGDFGGYSGNGYSYGHPGSNRWLGSHIPKYPQRKYGYGYGPDPGRYLFIYFH